MIRTSEDDFCRNGKRMWGSGSNGNLGPQMGREFVPMLNSVGQAQKVLDEIERYKLDWARANAHYLLAYNEPGRKKSNKIISWNL